MPAGKPQIAASAADTKALTTSSEAFDRLTRGDLDIEGYLDARVEEAIAPLAGKLPAERLTWLRQMLRDQLITDPVMRERLRQAVAWDPLSQ